MPSPSIVKAPDAGLHSQGESLSGAFRWERDVLRLERAVLQQSHSRYEVQGEYTIPPTATIPRTAASLALAAPATPGGAGEAGQVAPAAQPSPAKADWNAATGRWRLQVLQLPMPLTLSSGPPYADAEV